MAKALCSLSLRERAGVRVLFSEGDYDGEACMTFDEILTQVLALLRRDGRVSYRALKRRFDLDEDYLEDLKTEIIQA